jgi:integrase
VEALLASIDRASPIGKRDFAMFSLMTTYGLRACDVVALALDDIHWRGGHICVRQSKTGKPALFGTALCISFSISTCALRGKIWTSPPNFHRLVQLISISSR